MCFVLLDWFPSAKNLIIDVNRLFTFKPLTTFIEVDWCFTEDKSYTSTVFYFCLYFTVVKWLDEVACISQVKIPHRPNDNLASFSDLQPPLKVQRTN